MHDPQAVPAIDLSGDLSFEQWLEIGAELGRAEDRLQWAIGDWWVYGEHRYGRRKAIVETGDWRGPAFQACMDAGAVARKFETSRRREVLTFSHHREVASLPPAEADALLDWCEEPLRGGGKRPRSVRDLRVRKYEIQAEADAAFRAALPPIRYHELPAETIVVQIVRSDQPPAPAPAGPAVELDTSAADGLVPDALRRVQVEPVVAPDRLAMARAALTALSFPETLQLNRAVLPTLPFAGALQLIAEWFDTLSAEEKAEVRSRIGAR
jgi:hypothetical protein